MKLLRKYTNSFNAYLDKTLLESYGIQSVILNENQNIITGAINTDLIGIRLMVNEEDYIQSLKILEASSSSL